MTVPRSSRSIYFPPPFLIFFHSFPLIFHHLFLFSFFPILFYPSSSPFSAQSLSFPVFPIIFTTLLLLFLFIFFSHHNPFPLLSLFFSSWSWSLEELESSNWNDSSSSSSPSSSSYFCLENLWRWTLTIFQSSSNDNLPLSKNRLDIFQLNSFKLCSF